MKIGNRLFIKGINDKLALHKRGEKQTLISLCLLCALGSIATVAQADQITNDLVPEMFSNHYNDGESVEYQIQINEPSSNSLIIPNIQSIHQQSRVLNRHILVHNFNSLNQSFNVNRFLDQQKAFHQDLAPQTLKLPTSSSTEQLRHQRALFLVKLQILVILYVLFKNFVPLSKSNNERKSKIHASKMIFRSKKKVNKHKKVIIKVAITFHDVYGNHDGLESPSKIVKLGKSNKTYIVKAPTSWAFIQPNGMVTDHVKLNYRDGNQNLKVIPIYKGLTYWYDKTTKMLEFTHGTLDKSNIKSFLNNNDVPKGIPANKIISIKFAHLTHVNVPNIEKIFMDNSYLRLVNVKGFVINRPQSTPHVSHHVFERDIHERTHVLPHENRATHQAETNALHELSTIIGGLDDQHRLNNN